MDIDWIQAAADLDAHGCALIPGLLSPDACAEVAASYDDGALFRSTVVMARHGFGRRHTLGIIFHDAL